MSAFLIADDSPGKITMIKVLLRHAKWAGEIFVATTTEEATRLIDAHPEIRFAFIDYYIPSAYGPSVIRYLTTKNKDTHCALVSSSDNRENAQEARDAGAEAVLCTSYQSDEVEKAILELLQQWKELM